MSHFQEKTILKETQSRKFMDDISYDPNSTINLSQKEKLASFNNINHLKIYIIHNATLTTSSVVKIPILKQQNRI